MVPWQYMVVVVVEAGDVIWSKITASWDRAETNPSLHFLFKTNYSGLARPARLTFYSDGENKPKTVWTQYNALTAVTSFYSNYWSRSCPANTML